jgi:hypothetical protein
MLRREPSHRSSGAGKGVDDFRSSHAGALLHGVDVVHLNRNIGMNMSLDAELHHAELHLALIGAEEEDPVQPVPTVEADHLFVRGATLVTPLRQDVRLDPLHGHADSLGRHRRGTQSTRFASPIILVPGFDPHCRLTTARGLSKR